MAGKIAYLLRYRSTGSDWAEMPLGEGETLLGRTSDCHVRLELGEVSRHHAAIKIQDGQIELTDLGSTNGTQVDGQPLSPRRGMVLNPGQVFTISSYELMVEQSKKAADVTMVNIASPADKAGQSGLIGTRLDIKAEDLLRYAEEQQAKGLSLKDVENVTIGRAEDNNVVLPHPMVSRYHAVIERLGARYHLRDLRSSHGVYINDARVDREAWLDEGDEVKIGPYSFVFMKDGLEQRAEAALGIEARNLNRKVRGSNLLQNISLSIQPQEFIAIVGMSGAGKTTLLNALSGYRPATSGQVLVGDIDLYAHYNQFRNDIGYVPQRDIVHLELDPQSALDYAGQIRMPPDTTTAERKQRVAEVLADLDLTERRSVPIGKLSGGQIKRVSIGVELLTKPRLFFLDEPTSGLDPGTEYDMMRLLRHLADQGRTVLLVTHATKNVMLCDKVIFMARGGYMAFFGAPEEALSYFDGYRNSREQRQKEMEFDDIYRILNDETRGTPAEWAGRYEQYRASAKAALAPVPAASVEPKAPARRQLQARISAWRQLVVLSIRNLHILFQDKISLGLMLAIAPLLGLEDFVWGRTLYDPVDGDASKLIMMWFVTGLTAVLVGSLASVREIVKEVDIYKRERAVSLRVGPYIGSKVWVGIVLSFYQAAVLLFFRWIFVNPVMSNVLGYVAIYITLFLATLVGYLIGLAISSAAPNQNAALLLMVGVLVPQFLFSGGLLPLSLIPGGDAISVVIPTRWTFEAFLNTTGIGETLGTDTCWALSADERETLTDADKEACPCMGPHLFDQCTGVPGLRAPDIYSTQGQAALAHPRPVEPVQPTPFPTPTALPTPSSFGAMPAFFEGIQAQADEYSAAREGQGDDYANAMRRYGDQRAAWQEDREKAISKAEGMLGKIYDDYGRAFKGSVVERWAALLMIGAVLVVFIFGFQRLKDVV